MRPFAERFPRLFHVADRAALPSIRQHGLRSAASLCRLHGVPAAARSALLDENRGAYAPIASGVALRWQGMRDEPLARRLVPGLDPVSWRRLINSRVFLFARRADADRLRAREQARDQVILGFATAALLSAGLDLRACRYNNGYMDRRSLAAPRLRGPDDYVPAAGWGPGVPREVTVADAIPCQIDFELCA
ncbi:MAG: DUF7002 family protein [Janthinobacterium lividum]